MKSGQFWRSQVTRRNAWFCLQVNEGDSDDTDLQIFCVSCSHPVNPKVALRHMERCYAKVIWKNKKHAILWFPKRTKCVTFLCVSTVWKSNFFWFHVPYKNRRVGKTIVMYSQFFPFNLKTQTTSFLYTEQPDSSVTCTIPKAKHIVRGSRFCVQNIPEIRRSVGISCLQNLCVILWFIK